MEKQLLFLLQPQTLVNLSDCSHIVTIARFKNNWVPLLLPPMLWVRQVLPKNLEWFDYLAKWNHIDLQKMYWNLIQQISSFLFSFVNTFITKFECECNWYILCTTNPVDTTAWCQIYCGKIKLNFNVTKPFRELFNFSRLQIVSAIFPVT